MFGLYWFVDCCLNLCVFVAWLVTLFGLLWLFDLRVGGLDCEPVVVFLLFSGLLVLILC